MTATWDTDDFVAPEGFEPGFFLIRMGVSPSASLTVTVGSHTWVATDDVEYDEFIPFLMFDADGDFLGARFLGENSAGEFFGAFVFFFLQSGRTTGPFRRIFGFPARRRDWRLW